MGVEKIISGGQTGADRGGLEAAKSLGLKTGGWAPKDFRTEKGNDPSLKEFGLEATPEWDYGTRTRLNILEADGTIIFGNPKSSGSALTIKLCRQHKKPFYVLESFSFNPALVQVWLEANDIKTLNVAGNRESKNAGIQEKVLNYLKTLLQPEKDEKGG